MEEKIVTISQDTIAALEGLPQAQRDALLKNALAQSVASLDYPPARPPVWTLSGGVLPRSMCRRLIQTVEALDQWQIPTTFSGDPEYRVAKVFWLRPDQFAPIFDAVRVYANTVAALMGIEIESIDELVSIQMSKYEGADSYYKMHADHDSLRSNIDQERKLSIVIALTLGGHLFELEGMQAFHLQEGDALAFPATARHQAPPQAGIRFSLAVWVNGPPWK